MARMAHNDYLEQACDSGTPGFVLFCLFMLGLIALVGRRLLGSEDAIAKAIWLGLVGWALQELVEFGLYIPALAWPVFLLLGYLARMCQGIPGNHIDNPNRAR